MATSPEYLRLATSSSRALADSALDGLRDAVLVVEARHSHCPIVLANAAARRCLTLDSDAAGLIEAPLPRYLGVASAATLETLLAVPSDLQAPIHQVLLWRFTGGETAVNTTVKALPGNPGQRLVMLTFASEPGLIEAIENLPVDLLILDAKLRVIYANASAERSCASPPGPLGAFARRLIPTCALHPEVFAHALQGSSFHDDAVEIAAPARPSRWFEVDVQPLRRGSAVIGAVVMSIDVTERRLRKHSQSLGAGRLLALTEHARDIISVADAQGQLQYVSGGIRNSLGYTSEEQQSNTLFEHVHPEDQVALRALYRQLVDGEIKSFSREFRVAHKDGTYRWLESSYSAEFDNPLIGGVVINSRDITKRKTAENQLTEREEIFRLAAEAVDGVIYEWDVARGLVHRSRGMLEVLGLEPDDLAPTIAAWRERVHPHDFEAVHRAVNLGLLNGRGWTTTYRIRDSRGRYRSILERGLIQRNAGGDPVRAIGCAVDVSEIKRVTDLLAETQRIAQIGAWEYSYTTRELTWTDEMYSIYETSAEEFAVSWHSMMQRCTPESLRRFCEASAQAEASEGQQFDLEVEIDTLRDRRLWVRIIGNIDKLDGQPFRAFGSVQNVQAQKLAQIALESSSGWLKLSMNMAHMHGWRWHKDQDLFEFAIVDGHPVRLPKVSPGMKSLLARVHPKDRKSVSRAIAEAMEHRSEVQREFRMRTTDGQYRWFAAIARPVAEAGKVSGLVGVIQDVTARRDSERRLRRSEELLRATTANAADVLILLDTHLKVRFINKAVGKRSIEQIIGAGIGQLLPPAARAGVLDKLRHILATGETATYDYEAFHGGEVRYFENRAVLVRDEGIGTGISISTRDVTERKRLEQEILDISGRERQSIGRDLHDGLGQELTGVALMLRGVATRMGECCPPAVDSINEIVTVVNRSIDDARSLARGLLPVRTDTGGLHFALRELAARSHDLYGLEVNFRSEVWPELTLDETDASHLYRIAQEALTNAARHGHASHVDIFLLVNLTTFLLRITDDGEGISLPTSPYTGMGLKIMKYRAGMIGASFEISRGEPRGTVVCVTGEQPRAGSCIDEGARL
jgi:PAS domain S-box-containing protein